VGGGAGVAFTPRLSGPRLGGTAAAGTTVRSAWRESADFVIMPVSRDRFDARIPCLRAGAGSPNAIRRGVWRLEVSAPLSARPSGSARRSSPASGDAMNAWPPPGSALKRSRLRRSAERWPPTSDPLTSDDPGRWPPLDSGGLPGPTRRAPTRLAMAADLRSHERGPFSETRKQEPVPCELS